MPRILPEHEPPSASRPDELWFGVIGVRGVVAACPHRSPPSCCQHLQNTHKHTKEALLKPQHNPKLSSRSLRARGVNDVTHLVVAPRRRGRHRLRRAPSLIVPVDHHFYKQESGRSAFARVMTSARPTGIVDFTPPQKTRACSTLSIFVQGSVCCGAATRSPSPPLCRRHTTSGQPAHSE